MAVSFYVYSDRIAEDGFNYPVDSTWLATFGEWNAGYVPPYIITDPRYWISTITSNWDNTDNWSYTDGGAGGAPIPTPQNIAVFNGSANGDCDIDSSVCIKGIYVNGYAGTINQNSYRIRVDESGGLFWSGDFSGGGNDIRIQGNLYIGGFANFLSTDQTLSCDSVFQYYNTANFFHNDGVVSLDASGSMLEAYQMHLSTLQLNGDKVRIGESCYVNDLLVLKSGSARHLNTDGTIYVMGDMSCGRNYNQWNSFNNLSLYLNGTAQQLIHNQAGCIIPTLNVNKNTSPVVLCDGQSPLWVKGDFILYDGTFNLGGLDIQVGL